MRHLNMVFVHEIDPSMGPPAHQAKLNDAHEGLDLREFTKSAQMRAYLLSELPLRPDADVESGKVVEFAIKLGFTREEIETERARRRAVKVGGPIASSGLSGVRINC